MSKKHFDLYYEKICKQYFEMLADLKEFEKACANQIVSGEQLEEFKKTLEPIKNSYMTVSYLAHLLNQPNKKSKLRPYQLRNKKFLNSLDTTKSLDSVLSKNDKCLSDLKEMTKWMN